MHTYDLSKRRVTQTQHDKKPIEQCFRGCALNDSLVWNIITNNNQSNSFPITNWNLKPLTAILLCFLSFSLKYNQRNPVV